VDSIRIQGHSQIKAIIHYHRHPFSGSQFTNLLAQFKHLPIGEPGFFPKLNPGDSGINGSFQNREKISFGTKGSVGYQA
jgi:hypothetical protein